MSTARSALLCASLLLAACGGSSGGGEDDDDALTGIGELNFEVGCDWRETFRDGDQYLSLADSAARYWYALTPTEPAAGTRVLIDGRYPDARYFSLHLYDGYLLVRDARADYRLSADLGSFNPYLDKTRRSALIPPGGNWSAAVAFEARPSRPETNVLYRGDRSDETDPLQRRSFLVYRSYLPAEAEPELPTLTLQRADGTEIPLAETPETADCEALNEALSEFQHADGDLFTPGEPPVPEDPPRFEIYYPSEDELPPLVYNIHVRYMSAALDAGLGDLVVMRARAPTHTGGDGTLAAPQLRFWSVCTNRFETQLVDGCSHDAATPLDGDGSFTLVVSPPDRRPANATAEAGFAWLPLHGDTELLIYRMMLAANSFEQSIGQVPSGQDPASVMGDYFPQITYCDRAVFESAQGLTPAETFAVCAASGH